MSKLLIIVDDKHKETFEYLNDIWNLEKVIPVKQIVSDEAGEISAKGRHLRLVPSNAWSVCLSSEKTI